MEEIIKRMQNRIMQHQQENGFETIFDFLNEDFEELKNIGLKPVKMKFKDAPVGARLKLSNSIFVKLDHIDNGIIVEWHGNINKHQSYFCWSDKEYGIDLDTEIELI